MTEQKAKRRLAAILAADIVGYSRLMGQDEVATVRDLKGHQAVLLPLVGEFGGRVIDTAGDGILAEFPSAVAAVECATEIQRIMTARTVDQSESRRMQFRVGINLGDVIHDERRIYGDGINVAARLENIAEPGGVCISEDVYRQVRDKLNLRCRDLGEQTLKNIARPVRVYAVTFATGSLASSPTILTAPPRSPQPSIVVLPFVNISGDEENEYFADGLSEELLNVLAKIRGLRVTSRTSAFSFKGKGIDIPTIAQKLGVAHVLEGSVRKSANRVRVSAQLIEAATDSHVWSNTYERELSDIFAVQDAIAQSVVTELRRALLREEPHAAEIATAAADVKAAVKGRARNAEAYELYLQGRFFESHLTRDDMKRAINHYQRALEVDSSYALAWAGLSRALREQADKFEDLPVMEGFVKARHAALQALQLEPELAEGHDALGRIQMLHDWNWDGAEASLRRALELAPGDASIMGSTAMLLGSLGRLNDAVAFLRGAVTLDPLNGEVHRTLAAWCLCADLVSEADASAAKALELNPKRGFAHSLLCWARLAQGRPAEALRAAQREPHEPHRLMGIALAHHALGRHAESDRALEELIATSATKAAFQIAEVYAYRGEADSAFEWLERAYAQRDSGLVMMKVVPSLRAVHGDPRWGPFVRKMGLAN